MVSIKDIAKACQVSAATVSKALNDQYDIGNETKERIRKAANEMGYFPNSAARALKTKRTYSIGVLFVDEANSGLTHEYFSAVLEGFKVQAESQGYDITFINTHIGKSQMSYYEHCKYRGMDGVVIACVDFDAPEVVELVNSEIPIVTIDHIFNNCTSIVSDNVSGIREIVNYVYGRGHRKIAYIHGQQNSSVTTDRLASFYKTCEELSIKVEEEYVCCADYLDSLASEKRTEELLRLKTPPTCILYPDDTSLIGGRNAIRERELKIPEDISIVGYDGIRMSQILNPKITTMKQDTQLIGKRAAEELIKAIEKPKAAIIQRVVVEGKLLEGDTVAKLFPKIGRAHV